MKKILDEGIVLKAIDYGEKDRIITIYTKHNGRVSAILKGIKKSNANFRFAAQPFCYAQFDLMGKGEILSVVDVVDINSFFAISRNYNALICGSAILEIVNSVSYYELENEELFEMMRKALSQLLTTDFDPYIILMRFAIKIFKSNGYELDFSKCAYCSKTLNNDLVAFDLQKLEFVNLKCASNSSLRISPRAFEIMQKISVTPLRNLEKIFLLDNEAEEIRKIISIYFNAKFNYELKSLKNA